MMCARRPWEPPRLFRTSLRIVLMFCGAREWRNGRRAGFRCQCPKGRGGSNPPSRTEEGPGQSDLTGTFVVLPPGRAGPIGSADMTPTCWSAWRERYVDPDGPSATS